MNTFVYVCANSLTQRAKEGNAETKKVFAEVLAL